MPNLKTQLDFAITEITANKQLLNDLRTADAQTAASLAYVMYVAGSTTKKVEDPVAAAKRLAKRYTQTNYELQKKMLQKQGLSPEEVEKKAAAWLKKREGDDGHDKCQRFTQDILSWLSEKEVVAARNGLKLILKQLNNGNKRTIY